MRLITLGDSMTTGEHSWAFSLSKILNYEFLNFAKPASQNSSQVDILQRWLLDNNFNHNDIVIWQIGFSKHPKIHIGMENLEKVQRADVHSRKIFDVDSFYIEKNKIDNLERIKLSYINPIFTSYSNRKIENDEAEVFQELIFMFSIIQKLGAKLLILRGKDDYIKNNHWENMKLFLLEKNINFINESLVDWCRQNNLEFMIDNYHPTSTSSNIYTKEILMPKLKELGWI